LKCLLLLFSIIFLVSCVPKVAPVNDPVNDPIKPPIKAPWPEDPAFELVDPRVEWKGCNCNSMTLGLGDEDFMHLMIYIKALEHLASKECNDAGQKTVQ